MSTIKLSCAAIYGIAIIMALKTSYLLGAGALSNGHLANRIIATICVVGVAVFIEIMERKEAKK